VATDGRRLAKQEGPAKAVGGQAASPGERTTIVPSRAMQLLDRALADNDAHAFLRASGDLLVSGPTRTNLLDLYVAVSAP